MKTGVKHAFVGLRIFVSDCCLCPYRYFFIVILFSIFDACFCFPWFELSNINCDQRVIHLLETVPKAVVRVYCRGE